jgi:hypothetical protein
MAVVTDPSPAPPAPDVHRPLQGDLGWFGWNIARGTVLWSDSVHRLHGYESGQVIPSSTLTFHHKHREDLYGCVDALHAGMVQNRLVVHEHRLVDVTGQTRTVVMICRPVNDSQGRTRNLRGFLLPTDVQHAGGAGSARAAEPLLPALMAAFDLSEAAARVLCSARRPLTARRNRQQRDFAVRWAATGQSHDPRRTLEDCLFPLEHLTLGHVTSEPLDLAA